MKTTEEFDNFDSTMRKLIAVPHSEIKAKLDAEKARKRKNAKMADAKKGLKSEK